MIAWQMTLSTQATEQYPLAPSVVDARTYSDAARYEREIERIFHRSWFPVCPSADLAGPRDFVVWDRLEQSIAIVRQDDGTVAAWHNVCQHRGAKIVTPRGTAGRDASRARGTASPTTSAARCAACR